MKTQGVSLPHAVQILKQGAVLEGQRVGVARSHVRHLPSLVAGDATQADDQLVLAYLQGRGLGNGDFGIGTDAPVGVYVNGVYTGKTGGALLNFVERCGT